MSNVTRIRNETTTGIRETQLTGVFLKQDRTYKQSTSSHEEGVILHSKHLQFIYNNNNKYIRVQKSTVLCVENKI